MSELVRVAALAGYFEVMTSFGIEPRPLLREQGLDARLLTNPEQLIPARAVVRLLERSAQATGCITFGLRMAEGRAIANLGAPSLLIALQPTLRRALAAVAEFRERINSTLVLSIEERDGEAILREDFSFERPEPSRQASDLAMGVLARLCGEVLADRWQPLAICFAHPPPPAADSAIVARLFRCPAQYDCDFNGLLVRSSDLDMPRQGIDDQLAGHARQLLEAVMSPAERSATDEVRHLIKLMMPSGRVTIQACAASMGVTVRTLQRMLDAEGASFSDLLNTARMQLAVQYLANPRMRVTDIAIMLGYSSIGAFTRWHSQTFGRPPRQMRRDAVG